MVGRGRKAACLLRALLTLRPDDSWRPQPPLPALMTTLKHDNVTAGAVTAAAGKVHRVEDWGRRQLAYQIQKLGKAHYVCLNIECSKDTLAEIETGFKFNDAVLRHLTVQKKKAETGPSSMMKTVEREEARKASQAEYAAAGER